MSIITTYPGIPVVAGEDLLIIADISEDGNPTRTVSVDALGSYIGATGGGSGVSTVNGGTGAVTIIGGTNITVGTVGNTITINSTAGGGSVTSVGLSHAGGAFLVTPASTPVTSNGTLAVTMAGTAAQYINGIGNLANINTLVASGALTLVVDRTSGPTTLIGNVLNVPEYATGGIVTSLVVDRTAGDSTLISGVLNIPNYTDTTSFNVNGDAGSTPVVSKNGTLNIYGGTGIQSIVSQPIAGSASATLNLSVSGVVSGSYTNTDLTVDAYGRITTAASGSGGAVATATVLGLVKLNSNSQQAAVAQSITSTTNRTYGVQLNSTDQMVVNVPWVDVGYTSYVQLLTQNGSAAPSGPVLENTAGISNIVWTRTSAGLYVGTFGITGIADIDKTAIMIHSGIKSSGGTCTASINAFTGTTNFKLGVFDDSGTFTDSQLLRATLEIRIYP